MIVVIDGPAGSGKSSTARAVAEQLQIQYLDSGALYRAATLIYVEANQDRALFLERLKERKISFYFKTGFFHVFIDEVEVSGRIREMDVSAKVSTVAAMAEVRAHINALMHTAVQTDSYIADGRDLGTAVFPNAELKFYMIADLETRARRRHNELSENDANTSLQQVMDNIASRDEIDSNRASDPLKKADDALEIDTGTFTFNEQVDWICKRIKPLLHSTP